MANKKFVLGMLVTVLAFGMMVVGCDNGTIDDEYDDRPYLFGVSLDNRFPVVGETITAKYLSNDQIGTPSWRWYKSKEDIPWLENVKDKTFIGSGTTYTVKQNDVGFWIWAELSSSGNRGTADARTFSTVIGIPATANVSVSIRAVYYPSRSYGNNYDVTVTLTLSDGRWNNISYSTASQWITMSGSPSVSSWYLNQYDTPSVSPWGRELVFSYSTRTDTTLSISNLTATLNTAQLSTMRSSTNVYNTLTAGTSTASVSEWTISQ
jgi:hypothetical protein